MTQPTIEQTEIEAVDIEETLNPFHEDDGSDNERRSHYVSPGDNLEFQARYGPVIDAAQLVSTARFHQAEIVAVCGYKWIPKYKPEVYPVCSKCANGAADRLLG